MGGIADLLDSDVEANNYIDENSIISSISDATDAVPARENVGAKTKAKKRSRVTMPKTKSRVAKSSPASAPKKTANKTTTAKQKLLVEAMQEEGIEEMDETEPKPRSRGKAAPKKTTKKPKTELIVPEEEQEEQEETEEVPIVARSDLAQLKGARVPKVLKAEKGSVKNKSQTEQISQVQSETYEPDLEMEDVDDLTVQQPPPKRARTESRTRQEPAYRRRAGSASDTERGDPSLRRKLGDITRKFENIDVKYRNLKEVGLTEANANVEKLRRQCEAATEASNNLVASLKNELAQQSSLAQEARKLKKELSAREDEIAKLKASQGDLTSSLGAAQNEIKTLQAKVIAARTANVEPPTTKTPGSAMKASRMTAVASAEAAQLAQITQLKLDLYGDLTGLIVRSVKRAEDGDTYDCIQTGRNGTLHFKLFIDQEDAKLASFEETEFLYTPLLDAGRDREMMEIMPPYLTEDITFARQNAAKFYQRVVDTLTRRTNEA